MILRLIEYENGGMVEVYSTVDRTASDYKNVLACCIYFAQQGAKTLITPGFVVDTIGNPLYEQIYATLKGTPYWGRCLDFCVDGVWYEHEGFDTTKDLADPKKRKLTYSNMLNRGIKQSDRIIVEDCEVGHRYARRSIFNRIHYEHQHITEVYIRTDAGFELLYKKGTD